MGFGEALIDESTCRAETSETSSRAESLGEVERLKVASPPGDNAPRSHSFGERDRPAGQINDDVTNTKGYGTKHSEGFRRDAENGDRDDRATQATESPPAKSLGLNS